MYQSIHGLNPHYLNDNVTMTVDMHGYNTMRPDDTYLPNIKNSMYRNSLLFKGGELFNRLPSNVKQSVSVNSFKTNYFKHTHGIP